MTDVRLDRRGAVAVVTFDGEAVLNAFSSATWEQLDAVLEEVERDDAVRAVVFTGAGRAFVAGADIRGYDGIDVEGFTAFQRLVGRVTRRLHELPKPTVAAINGYALGGGFELALACDLLVGRAGAKVGLPEITLGLLPGGGGTQRITRIVGPYRAAWLLMTGEPITVEQAHEWGIVDRVVDDALAAAVELAEQLAQRSPAALAVAKTLVATAMDVPLDEGLEAEIVRTAPLVTTPEAREGIAAFLRRSEVRS